MPITVRRLPKKPAPDRTLTSRLTEWAIHTSIGNIIAIAGALIGLFDHPIVVAIAISVSNIIGQCISILANRRRKKKNGIAGRLEWGDFR
jgi:hypothetical protein